MNEIRVKRKESVGLKVKRKQASKQASERVPNREPEKETKTRDHHRRW
jgi:hypothetical protein